RHLPTGKITALFLPFTPSIQALRQNSHPPSLLQTKKAQFTPELDLSFLLATVLINTYNVKIQKVGDSMTHIITGPNWAIYSGVHAPMVGPWNQPIHQNHNYIHVGHHYYHLIPTLYGYPPAFPYLGPYVPFRN
ncbi:hypothetical protein, partial [Neobacillus citreus]